MIYVQILLHKAFNGFMISSIFRMELQLEDFFVGLFKLLQKMIKFNL